MDIPGPARRYGCLYGVSTVTHGLIPMSASQALFLKLASNQSLCSFPLGARRHFSLWQSLLLSLDGLGCRSCMAVAGRSSVVVEQKGQAPAYCLSVAFSLALSPRSTDYTRRTVIGQSFSSKNEPCLSSPPCEPFSDQQTAGFL